MASHVVRAGYRPRGYRAQALKVGLVSRSSYKVPRIAREPRSAKGHRPVMEAFTDEELQEAAEVIRRWPPGIYTAPVLYGRNWDEKALPKVFGRRFKKAVATGRLTGLTIHPMRTSDNKTQYEVWGR